MMKRNISQTLEELRAGCLAPKKFMRLEHVTSDLINRLKLDRELTGHKGCVNCIEWNESGELLASGSDDTHVMIWDPFTYTLRTDISTKHTGNIFSVKFMPRFNNDKLITGAADSLIKLIDISAETVIEDFEVHSSRIKRLAVCDSDPYMFWSCSEDGTIGQFDTRIDTKVQCNSNYKNILINLKGLYLKYPAAEAKCIAINPVRSYQLGVGCNDGYVRLFDRRKLTNLSTQSQAHDIDLQTRSNRLSNGSISNVDFSPIIPPTDSVQYFSPGHCRLADPSASHNLSSNANNIKSQLSVTYLTFSPDGNSLLVNMSSEQIYLYDVARPNVPFCYSRSDLSQRVSRQYNESSPEHSDTPRTFQKESDQFILDYNEITKSCNHRDHTSTENNRFSYRYQNNTTPVSNSSDSTELPGYLEYYKNQGNAKYQNKDYLLAVFYYNLALNEGGHLYSRLYANRATAYIERKWTGDIYAALRDSIKALELESDHIKSHYRVTQCMFQLGMIAEAYDYLLFIKKTYPSQCTKIRQMQDLEKRITDRISDCIVRDQKEKNGSTNGNHRNGDSGNLIGPQQPIPVTDLQYIISKHSKCRMVYEQKHCHQEDLDWRTQAWDYRHRYCGHCNTTTDIKEANFFGIDGQYIMAGSDDGNIFFWERETENLVRVFCGDSSIVNCLQPHPTICFLASSGIDNVVRLWSPSTMFSENEKDETSNTEELIDHREDSEAFSAAIPRSYHMSDNPNVIGEEQNKIKTAQENQRRLAADPIEMVLVDMGYATTFPYYRSRNSDENDDDDDDDDDDDEDEESDNEPVSNSQFLRRTENVQNGDDDGDNDDTDRDEINESASRRTRRRRGRRRRMDDVEYCRTS